MFLSLFIPVAQYHSCQSSSPPCQAQGQTECIPLIVVLTTETACKLQACLSKHTYKPENCQCHLRELYKCCQKLYEETEDKGESTACPIPRVVKKWIKDHPE
ncbi:uncharacterized protein BT62DRAFT_292962 [Guyanagaster necrorhizus]|uniref:Cx9C motif-containing protein 4, mitochondrial n=1 Tax=Guyanagaster necrorhizus TaxID=856835 RepID=A0A9P7W5E7_9AGAR|nr:uncharacterized protein BT62DRAFT_292962 [Guyanagaster necrorhizus MCA 3950]KAG7452265.1 hypothetical protein BT62DRAFT_292962 [Guyanagaster necrorhizus MCA 3950]